MCIRDSNAFGMKIITTRMFSHEGARRGKEFAVSSFAYQIAKGEKNGNYVVKHGNLDSIRTYNHIDDAIEAMSVLDNAIACGFLKDEHSLIAQTWIKEYQSEIEQARNFLDNVGEKA